MYRNRIFLFCLIGMMFFLPGCMSNQELMRLTDEKVNAIGLSIEKLDKLILESDLSTEGKLEWKKLKTNYESLKIFVKDLKYALKGVNFISTTELISLVEKLL